jgi:hypothetical protein
VEKLAYIFCPSRDKRPKIGQFKGLSLGSKYVLGTLTGEMVSSRRGKGRSDRPRFETFSLKFKKSKIKVLAIFYFIRKLSRM